MRCNIPIFKAAACFFAAFALCRPVHALSFNITYDASVSNRSDYAQIVTAINYTALEFSSLFTNPITINILVQADPTISGGESTENYMPTTYSAVRSALIAHATSPDDVTADASLPVTDPTGGGIFTIAMAEAKAIGLLNATNPASDGAFGMGANDPWTYDPANRAVAGKEDFIGTAEHEFSEVMGRNSDLGFYMTNGYQPFDLFHYYAPGVRSFDLYATNDYFSIDGGVTDLKPFNPYSNGGDNMDWYEVSDPPDSFDAFGVLDAETPMFPVDLVVMNILGYTLNTTPARITNHTVLPNHTFSLSGTGVVSQTYILVAATNLAPPVVWTPLATNIAVLNGNFNFTDLTVTNFRTRFYRVNSP